ncbi:MAG TPA: hypothetical protein VL475_12335, partial [Planctomycetaceae bacterium]|nr:hypothetical protein [Planctomycetaceae bacterium]
MSTDSYQLSQNAPPSSGDRSQPAPADGMVAVNEDSATLRIGNRTLTTRYFLAPLAGYTHLAFRRVIRECGGVGLATTDLVQASHLVSGTRWAR